MLTRKTTLIALAAMMASRSVAAQEPIIAERPGFSSSPFALAPSMFQIESGYQYTRETGSVDDHTLPLALLRIGLVERVELQFGWPGITWRQAGGQDTHGTHDLNIGVKWQTNGQDARVPLALFAGLNLPTGDNQFGGDGIDPTVGAFWSLDYGMDWFGTALLRLVDSELVLGNAVGVSLPVSPAISSYLEYFGIYGTGGGPHHFMNGGFAYLLRNDLQLDLHLGAGLNDRAADFFLGFGVAYRF
ncbi:MAG: transporter [Woeseiaceae bacterium]|nr:transporter [Woeseiaceae bacterium]